MSTIRWPLAAHEGQEGLDLTRDVAASTGAGGGASLVSVVVTQPAAQVLARLLSQVACKELPDT